MATGEPEVAGVRRFDAMRIRRVLITLGSLLAGFAALGAPNKWW